MSRMVVVTGAGSGIGKSTVDVLGEQGTRLSVWT